MKITGNAPQIPRIETQFYSFDEAFRNRQGARGYPLGTIAEFYGANHTGKSTVVWSLSGLIGAKTNSDIVLADFEGFDPIFLESVFASQKFDGEIYSVEDPKDEEVLSNLLYKVKDKDNDFRIGILDSIGAISPIAESEGDLGDANMGRRALLINQFSRKASHILLNDKSKCFFLVNHQHPNIGTRGWNTPGGESKKYLSSIRVQLKRLYRSNKEETYPDGSYVIKGTVKKNRWGYKDGEFYFFVLGGSGIHRGLTALYDCIILGIVDIKRTIRIGDKSFGYLKDITEQAQLGNDEFFQPFYEEIENEKARQEESRTKRDKNIEPISTETENSNDTNLQDNSTETD